MPLTLRFGPYRQFTAVYRAFFRAGSTASQLANDLPAANLAPLSGIHVSIAGRRRASPDQPSGSGGRFLEALHDSRTRAQPQLSRARQVTADIPSRERRQPRREFEPAERLDQVVICPRVQAAAPVTDVSRTVSISAGVQTPAARSGRHSSKPSEPASITSRTIAAQGFSAAIHRPSRPSAATSPACLLEGAPEQPRHPHLGLNHEHPHNARPRSVICKDDEHSGPAGRCENSHRSLTADSSPIAHDRIAGPVPAVTYVTYGLRA